MNIIQLKCQYLLKYLISSLVLSGNFEAVQDIVLPVVLSEKSKYSDVFTRFTEALYDKFDFDEALALAKEFSKVAQDDLLLKSHAAELQAHAVLMIFHVKSKIYRTVSLKELTEESGIRNEEEARARLEDSIKKESYFIAEHD